MADQLVDLKLDRNLIDCCFDGYKLSLDPLPIYKSTLQEEPDKSSLTEDQHSYQHVRAFGLTNHIISDPWEENSVYVIDQTWNVLRITVTVTSPDPGQTVFEIPDHEEKRQISGRHNVSLSFPSPELAVLADGVGTLYILETGPRKESTKAWTVSHKCEPLEERGKFILFHSVFRSKDDAGRLECLLLHVEETAEERKGSNSSPFETLLEWVTLTSEKTGDWSISRTRRLVSSRCPEYAAIDADSGAVLTYNQRPFHMIYDSVKPVDKSGETTGKLDEEDRGPEYTWSQTEEEVTVLFTVPSSTPVVKADIYLSLHPQQVEFGVKNSKILLQGALEGRVDLDGSTWTLQNGRITLTLCKAEAGSWQAVVKGDSRGEMVMSSEQIEAIHNRLAHLTSDGWNPDPSLKDNRPYNTQELEECDMNTEDTAVLQRIDGESHTVTHQANVSSHQWLFTAQMQSDALPAVCLRHDVDRILWQPLPLTEGSSALAKHQATFNAFGYVQASKQQKRFCTAPPNASYAAIIDCVRHIYIYRQPEAISSPLRNRKTGRQVKAVAKQQLVALETVKDILGVHATNDRLFVLAGKTFHVIKVN